MPPDGIRRARAFCADYANHGGLSKELRALDVDLLLAWESISVSDHSPSPVDALECLARQVVDPAFYDARSGQVKPTLSDDASSRGASVDRMALVSRQQLHQMGRARAAQVAAISTTPKTYIGFVTLNTEQVRGITAGIDLDDCRAFAVYDTATESDHSHADICQLISGKAAGRSVRSRLFHLCKNSLQLADPD